MTIKEVEAYTGLSRSNIRFYEKEGLIAPVRTENNGYRNYSEEDVEDIKKIACLRTLGISVEKIHEIMEGEASLYGTLTEQRMRLREQIEDLSKAETVCERMMKTENIRFENLRVEKYVDDLQDYWKDNGTVFQLDSAGFLYIWSSLAAWAVIAALSLITAILSYGKLPPEIPVQWSGETAVSMTDKIVIFAYPLACVIVRIFLRQLLYTKIPAGPYSGIIAEYLTNFLCFVILSVEAFIVLFTYGLAKNVVIVMFVDGAVFMGFLAAAILKTQPRR